MVKGFQPGDYYVILLDSTHPILSRGEEMTEFAQRVFDGKIGNRKATFVPAFTPNDVEKISSRKDHHDRHHRHPVVAVFGTPDDLVEMSHDLVKAVSKIVTTAVFFLEESASPHVDVEGAAHPPAHLEWLKFNVRSASCCEWDHMILVHDNNTDMPKVLHHLHVSRARPIDKRCVEGVDDGCGGRSHTELHIGGGALASTTAASVRLPPAHGVGVGNIAGSAHGDVEAVAERPPPTAATTPKTERLIHILQSQQESTVAAVEAGREAADGERVKIYNAVSHRTSNVESPHEDCKKRGFGSDRCKCGDGGCAALVDFLDKSDHAARQGTEYVNHHQTRVSDLPLSKHPSVLTAIAAGGFMPHDRHVVYTHSSKVLDTISNILKSLRIPHVKITRREPAHMQAEKLKRHFVKEDEEAEHWRRSMRRERRAHKVRETISRRSSRAFERAVEAESRKSCDVVCPPGSEIVETSTRVEFVEDIDETAKSCRAVAAAASAAIRYHKRSTPWLLITDTALVTRPGHVTHLHILDAGTDSLKIIYQLAEAHGECTSKSTGLKVHYHISHGFDKLAPETRDEARRNHMIAKPLTSKLGAPASGAVWPGSFSSSGVIGTSGACDDDESESDLSECCDDDSDDTCCGDDGTRVRYSGVITTDSVCRRVDPASSLEAMTALQPVARRQMTSVKPYEEEYASSNGLLRRVVRGVIVTPPQTNVPTPAACPPPSSNANSSSALIRHTVRRVVDISSNNNSSHNKLAAFEGRHAHFHDDVNQLHDKTSSHDENRFGALLSHVSDRTSAWGVLKASATPLAYPRLKSAEDAEAM